MKWSKRSEILLGGVLLLFITLGGFLWWLTENQGLEPPACTPQTVGVWGPLKLTFKDPMQPSTVESRVSISPPSAGRWEWQGNEFVFTPLAPLKPAARDGDRYVIQLASGAQNLKGKTIAENQSCQVTVRQPSIVYQAVGEQPGELIEVGADGKNTKILAEFHSLILSYEAARDGELLVAAVQNRYEGSDLWVVDPVKQTQQLLVDCKQDKCEEPTWAPDGKEIMYTRAIVDPLGQKIHQPGQIWRINLLTLQNQPLENSRLSQGQNPHYSPDGQKMAFFDAQNNGIHIIRLNGTGDLLLKSNSPVMAWSPDSTRLLYFSDVVEAENHYMNTYLYNLPSRQSEILLNEYKGQFDFGFPIWSPDGQWITMSARLAQGGMSKQLIMLRVDGTDVKTITDTQVYTHTSYHWNADGSELLFQRLELGASTVKPQILIWNPVTETSNVVVEGGGMPDWLP